MNRWIIALTAVLLVAAGTAGLWAQSGNSGSGIKAILDDKKQVDRLLDEMLKNPELRRMLLDRIVAFARTHAETRKQLETLLNAPASAQKIKNEIIVKFKSGTTPDQIQSFASEYGLELVKAIPQLRMHVYRIPAAQNVEDVLKACRNQSIVEYAEPNQRVRILK